VKVLKFIYEFYLIFNNNLLDIKFFEYATAELQPLILQLTFKVRNSLSKSNIQGLAAFEETKVDVTRRIGPELL